MIWSNRAGRYAKSGSYAYFIPKPLPPSPALEMSDELTFALSAADRALARLDGATTTLPNPELFVYAFMRQEAVLSSQIEGTQASIDDIFEYEASSDVIEKSQDLLEVINYLSAIHWGLEQLSSKPLSLNLIREIHQRLLQNVRGAERAPGEFRQNQNWIGPPGCTIQEATFVPPAVPEMRQALHDWELFIHNNASIPPLIKCALAHAQFETIHPFWDGNGRLGRMIVTLMLCEQKILIQPVLYLSLFFRQHRETYYQMLQNVRDHGNWEHWVLFFLRGVRITSKAALESAQAIINLRDRLMHDVQQNIRTNKASVLANALFESPYVTNNRVAKIIDASFPTASKLVSEFEELGYLQNLADLKIRKIYAFKPFLDILHSQTDSLAGVVEGEDHLQTQPSGLAP